MEQTMDRGEDGREGEFFLMEGRIEQEDEGED